MLPGWLYREFDDRLRLYRHLWSQIYHANAIVLCYQLCHRVRYETSDEKSKLTSSIYVRRQMYITEVTYPDTYPKHIIKKWSVLPYLLYNITEDYFTLTYLKTHYWSYTRKYTISDEVFFHFIYNIFPKITSFYLPRKHTQSYQSRWGVLPYFIYNITEDYTTRTHTKDIPEIHMLRWCVLPFLYIVEFPKITP